MCEYLRPVVALEWLKACCTDMITWMSSFSTGRNTDSKELPVMAMWKIWNCQTLHKSLEITNALIAVHVTSQTLYTEITNALIAVHVTSQTLYTEITNAVHVTSLPGSLYVCTLRMLMKNTVQLVQQVHIHRCLIVPIRP